MNTLKSGGHTYSLHSITGKVIGYPQKITKNFQSSSPMPNGNISLQSFIVMCDNFFLLDSKNVQHAFQLQGFDLICLEGHEMTVVSSSTEEETTYIAIHNKTTRQTYFHAGNLEKMHKANKGLFMGLPPFILFMSGWVYNALDYPYCCHFFHDPFLREYLSKSFLSALELSPLSFFLPLWILYGLWKKSGNKGARRFVKNFRPEAY